MKKQTNKSNGATNNSRPNSQKSLFKLMASGQFCEVEKLCINNPQLREILLHWGGIRHTAFFKKRIKFYKEFAKERGLSEFSPEVKNQMRDEFASKHCLKKTIQDAIDSYDLAAFTTQISRIRFLQKLRRQRQRRLGL